MPFYAFNYSAPGRIGVNGCLIALSCFVCQEPRPREVKWLPQVSQNTHKKKKMPSDARTLPDLHLIPGYKLLHICAQIRGSPGVETALLLRQETAGGNWVLKGITASLAIGSHSFLQTIQPQALEGRGSLLKCVT